MWFMERKIPSWLYRQCPILSQEENKTSGRQFAMFNVKIKSEIIKGIIDVTSPLVNEAKFNITAKGTWY
jgi:hypothetical protein